MSGKIIIPFCTYDGYGAGGSYGELAQAVPNAACVLDGFSIEASNVQSKSNAILEWLDGLGIDQNLDNSSREEAKIKITMRDTVLDGVLYDSALAAQIQEHFPLMISMTIGNIMVGLNLHQNMQKKGNFF